MFSLTLEFFDIEETDLDTIPGFEKRFKVIDLGFRSWLARCPQESREIGHVKRPRLWTEQSSVLWA